MLCLETLRGWLAAEAEALRAKGFDVEVKSNGKGPKPSINLVVATNRFLVVLSMWVSGEVDIDMMNLETKEITIHKAGLRFDDTDYAAVFRVLADVLLNLRSSD